MFKKISTTLLIAVAAALAAGTPEGVPKEAKETAPGVYRFVDKDGKAWIYRHTPFGYSKRAEDETAKPQAAAESSERSRMTPFGETQRKSGYVDAIERTAKSTPASGAAAVKTKVTEDGDTLHFDRPSPLGSYKWSRKKDELSVDERRIWDEHRASTGAENKSK